jgi:glycerophosphoryl diester phosphodiesterase/acyl-CoA hydrolase
MIADQPQPARRVAESQVVMSQVMLPEDANPSGNVHGGAIMKLVDTTAGVAAMRHVRGRVVTARIDSMSFLEPVFIGDLVTLKASVNDVGTTSLEVGVRVEAENLQSGVVRHVSSAYLVFVALDEAGHPRPVPPLIAESGVERRRQAEAKHRRRHRQRGEEAMRQLRAGLSNGSGTGDRASAERFARWKKPGSAFVLVGHRGAAGLAPENTLPSFELALALGADAVECDVHLSADGVPVIIHDSTVDRTTNGKGSVARLTASELQALDASYRFRETARARIPTLDELLSWARGRTRVVIELKGTENPSLVEKTIDLIRERRMLEDCFLISFDHAALGEARRLGPDLLTGALYVARPADPVGLANAALADALAPECSTVTPELVRTAHEAGLLVCVWTANESAAIRAALAAEVDAVTSDFPDRVRAIEREGR